MHPAGRHMPAVWAFLALLIAPCSLALEPAYLAEWPGVERVLADFQDGDHYDTMARQMAALNQLDRAIEDMADDRRWNDLTKDEIALRGRYRQAAARIREEANGSLSNELGPGFHWPGEEPPLQQWHSRQWLYESDPGFRAATLSRYLSPPLLNELNVRKASSDARARATGQELLRGLGYRESTWSGLGASGQDAVASVGALLVLVLALMLLREMRRFGALKSDPTKIRAGFRVFDMTTFTGILEDYQTSAGDTREGFQLIDATGRLKFQVGISMADVNIPEGHCATAAWIHRADKREKFWYLLFLDHDTGAIRPVRIILRRLFKPLRWLFLPILGLAFLTGSVSDWVPADSPFFRGLLVAVIAAVLAPLVGDRITERRIRRFVERDGPRILHAHAGYAAAAGRTASQRHDTNSHGNQASPDDIKAAAREVIASLEPYVAAARSSSRPLAHTIWTQPYVVGFVTMYSKHALRDVVGVPSPSLDSGLAVNTRVLGTFMSGTRRTEGEVPDLTRDPAWAGQFGSGSRAANLVLACFAGDRAALDDPAVVEVLRQEVSPRGSPGTPPATRLHPQGPSAAAAQRVALYLFTGQLQALDAAAP